MSACARQLRECTVNCRAQSLLTPGAPIMSKARDTKKMEKKEPAKTVKEKRAAKKEKKEANLRKGSL